jgi:prevent-host-death family protein
VAGLDHPEDDAEGVSLVTGSSRTEHVPGDRTRNHLSLNLIIRFMKTVSAKTVSATEASRHFSDLLDRVSHHEESFVIVRRGEAVARLDGMKTTAESPLLGELLSSLASVRTGEPSFADDLEAIRRDQPSLDDEPWHS